MTADVSGVARRMRSNWLLSLQRQLFQITQNVFGCGRMCGYSLISIAGHLLISPRPPPKNFPWPRPWLHVQ